jgi:putative transposase
LKLVRSHGLVAMERLNIRGMSRNHRLARAILDAAWGGFQNILAYVAPSAGSEAAAEDARGTSQECSGCGEDVPKTLSVRVHRCPRCGLCLHRDENAARNILARVLLARTGPAGVNGHPAVA